MICNGCRNIDLAICLWRNRRNITIAQHIIGNNNVCRLTTIDDHRECIANFCFFWNRNFYRYIRTLTQFSAIDDTVIIAICCNFNFWCRNHACIWNCCFICARFGNQTCIWIGYSPFDRNILTDWR